MRIKKANAIVKLPVNKLYPTKYTYHDTNQTGKAREQKLRPEAVTDELRENMTVNCVNIGRQKESLNIANINEIEIFPSVNRFISILLRAAATSASVERVNSKERVPKVPCLIPEVSYAQR